MPYKGPKTEFMQGEGYSLYSDIGHQILDRLAEVEPKKLPNKDLNKSNFVQLYQICGQLEDEVHVGIRRQLGLIGFTNDDRETIADATAKGADIFSQGIADLDFPFHFVPILMMDMLEATKEKLDLSSEELATFGMSDFASIMREQWFQDMLTDTAKTSNGVWARVGKNEEDYRPDRGLLPGRFARFRGGSPEEFYEVAIDPSDNDLEIARIGLSRAAKQTLTDSLRHEDTVGCPVAAKSRLVDPTNPHTKALVKNGHLTITPRSNGTFRGRQETTPIERSALIIADFLDKYVDEFGEPNRLNLP